MGAFKLGDLLNDQSKPAARAEGAFAIRHIALDKIRPSEDNFYGVRDIEDLAASIESLGLQQPLVVLEADEDGMHELISGERRHSACWTLYEGGNELYRTVPCVVIPHGPREWVKLQLLHANAMTRKLNDYESAQQAQQIEAALRQLKKDGYKFAGRMRDHVAKMMDVSPAQAGRLAKIARDLAPEVAEKLRDGEIGVTEAYELSKLPKEEQVGALEGARERQESLPKLEQKKERAQNNHTEHFRQSKLRRLLEEHGVALLEDDGKPRWADEVGRDVLWAAGLLEAGEA